VKAFKIYGPADGRLVEEDTPAPRPHEVLVRVQYAGICGSDIHYYFEGRAGVFALKEPLTPGHELSGIVADDPSGRYATGTPVTINPARFGSSVPGLAGRPHLWPGGSYLGSASTRPHTQGGMAEYRVVDSDMVRPLPAGMAVRTGALAEPLAVALHALKTAGGVRGKRILVVGCGPIGLCVIGACVANGAAQVDCVDLHETARDRGLAVGARRGYRADEATTLSNAYDVVFECSGVGAAIGTAFAAVRPAGDIVQVGNLPAGDIQAAIGAIVSKEVTYRGSFRINDEFDDAIGLLAREPAFQSIITHELDAGSIDAAFDLARDSARSGKVLVSLWLDDPSH
jgi:L-idonate 5-dehydrogenase